MRYSCLEVDISFEPGVECKSFFMKKLSETNCLYKQTNLCFFTGWDLDLYIYFNQDSWDRKEHFFPSPFVSFRHLMFIILEESNWRIQYYWNWKNFNQVRKALFWRSLQIGSSLLSHFGRVQPRILWNRNFLKQINKHSGKTKRITFTKKSLIKMSYAWEYISVAVYDLLGRWDEHIKKLIHSCMKIFISTDL